MRVHCDPASTLRLVRLRLEMALGRAAGRLSRIAGRGGGTTLPGKLLVTLDSGAVTRLAERLRLGSALLSATNGKTTTAAMAVEILAPSMRLAYNGAGANLVSGIASALIESEQADLGLFEVDEAAIPDIVRQVRPRVVSLGNLFRDQLDRYGELELTAERWRSAVGGLSESARLVVNADDPVVADLAFGRPNSATFGVDDPRHARPALQHAADSKYCLRCGQPYVYAAAYIGHLGDYRCTACGHGRPPLDVAARAIELRGLDGSDFDLVTPEGTRRVRLSLPGLYNVYNALAAASVTRALDTHLDPIVAGLERATPAFGRFERIAIADKELLLLLIKNPAGANEVIQTLVQSGAPSVVVIALNDAVADGRDVSWIWDVDFEALLDGVERLVAAGDRATELALRFKYGGLPEQAIEVVPDLEAAFDRGLELTTSGGRLVVLPTYTAMLALRAIVQRRGHVQPYWERAA